MLTFYNTKKTSPGGGNPDRPDHKDVIDRPNIPVKKGLIGGGLNMVTQLPLTGGETAVATSIFTLIATFSSNGKYPYPENPTPHVGVLYQHTPDGIYLLDQNHLDSSYGSSPIGEIAVHFVPFNNNKGPSNASNFYVVEQ